jgi:hypothetical protein
MLPGGARMTLVRRSVSPRLVVLACASALVLAACGGDDDTSGAVTTTGAPGEITTTTAADDTTTTPSPVTTTAPACPEPGVAGDVALSGGDLSDVRTVRDLVVEGEGCTDRVELVFVSGVPGYRVEYQAGPFTQDGSGRPVSVAGSAFVVVRLEPANSYDFERGVEVYAGERDITSTGTRFVRQVVNTGDFEAVMTWIVGLSARVPFTVEAQVDRLVLTFG